VSRAQSSLSFHVPRSNASPASAERSQVSIVSSHGHTHGHGHHGPSSHAATEAHAAAHGYSSDAFTAVEASLAYAHPLPDSDPALDAALLAPLPCLFDAPVGTQHVPAPERFAALNLPAEAFRDSKTAAMDLPGLDPREWLRVQVRALYRSHHPALIHYPAAAHDRELPLPRFNYPSHYELLKKGKKQVLCPVVAGHDLDMVHLMMLNLLLLPRPLKEVAAVSYRRRVSPDMWVLMYATMDAAREAATHFDGLLSARGHEVLCKILAKRVQQFKLCLCLSSFERNLERSSPIPLTPGAETGCIRDILARENARTRPITDPNITPAHAFSSPVDTRDLNNVLEQFSREFLRDHPPDPERKRLREEARALRKRQGAARTQK
jgi:hypothetical protein